MKLNTDITLKFYIPSNEYLKYLRDVEPSIMQTSYDKDKFVIGAVLNIDDKNYFAPISSAQISKKPQWYGIDGKIKKHIKESSVIIRNVKGETTSLIRFGRMFPVPMIELVELEIKIIQDIKYSDLIKMEYEFCVNNKTLILSKAIKIYNDVIENGVNKYSNDFTKLDLAYMLWIEKE